jgi:hypothetical protein
MEKPEFTNLNLWVYSGLAENKNEKVFMMKFAFYPVIYGVR